MLKDDTLQTRRSIRDEGAVHLDPGAEVSGWSITLLLKGVLSEGWRHRLPRAEARVLFNDVLRVIYAHRRRIHSLFCLIINGTCYFPLLSILRILNLPYFNQLPSLSVSQVEVIIKSLEKKMNFLFVTSEFV